MMTIMGKNYSKRGVSVIIAALLLIAIAVAAAVLLYVFSIGLMGSLSSSGGSQTKDQVIMEAYSWNTPPTAVTLTLRNTGSSSVVLTVPGGADYFFNGISMDTVVTAPPTGTSCLSETSTAPLTPGNSCGVVITPGTLAGTITPGVAYPVKVVTPDGGVFSYSVIVGQSS
jgi:FlaG/FlaF family flagellin (archaellin)